VPAKSLATPAPDVERARYTIPMPPLWEVTCIAGTTTLDLGAQGTAIEAANAGLMAATNAHPDVPRESWLLLTVHLQDGRANLYGWRWSDGRFREVRREHWHETTAKARRRRSR
jgi:hypothetical protein